MRALVLDGCAAGSRDMADALRAALKPLLASRGYAEVGERDLAALPVPDCKGDFGCWTVTPGVCVQPGPHRDVARDLIRSDLAVWVTPVTFGGYASALKRHLDHCIPLISPLFTTIDGETHHEPRYARAPSLLVLGLLERPDAAAAAVFHRLARRNALNLHAPRVASVCLSRGELPERVAVLARALDELAGAARPRPAAEPLDLAAPHLEPAPPRRALLLVGSPRGESSVSAAIAKHLAGLLGAGGLAVTTEHLHRRLREDPGLGSLAASAREADVLGLMTPLYVDALPGPVTAALEVLGQPGGRLGGRRFFAVANCGFPEAVHNDTALAICRLFAASAGLGWMGGLAVGGGGMLAGRPIAEQGGRARNVVEALALCADAIRRGVEIPAAAQRLARTPSVPAWLYRAVGSWGLRLDAVRRGTWSRIGDRPYAEG